MFHEYDKRRSFAPKYDYFGKETLSPIGRPMQVAMWFPGKNTAEKTPLTYRDFIAFTSSEVDFSRQSEFERDQHINSLLNSLPENAKAGYIKFWQQPTRSYLNIEVAEDNFPVLLYAPPMNASIHDNALLCEFLASHGYIVVSVAAKGEFTRLQKQSIDEANIQAADLSFLWEFAQRFTQNSKVAALGFSLGGLSNLIFATQNKDIDAVVSLDSSVMSQGWLEDLQASPFYQPSEFTAKLLMISKNMKQPSLNPADFYQQVNFADKWLIRYDHNTHYYFSSEQLQLRMQFEQFSPKEKTAITNFYADMSYNVLDFLNFSLLDKGAVLQRPQRDIKHSFEWGKAKKQPLLPETIPNLILQRGFHYVRAILSDIESYSPEYTARLSWRSLNATAKNLVQRKRFDEAILTLELSLEAFPNWYQTHAMLADYQLKFGIKEQAIKHYRQALKDNPIHKETIKALTTLGEDYLDYKNQFVPDIEVAKYIGKYVVDEKRFRKIYRENGQLFLYSNYWDKPLKLWPYKNDLFLVKSDDGQSNMQILFQFDDAGNVASMKTRGLNSGRIGDENLKR
ncbi:hypothetical protein GCM10017161_27050 [Thalassotalea marina]|uniref:Xaa-Pro dipeptidyl-peptidase-like domain-containing protein n=1 Tax=Thalassotalea marina TaxID=1673741 RepID=A0A919BKU8_9GAMM|nr:hypothetical protein GCM10017161_27050 [Thalassotalea marina]